jgi:hypothetical protein
MWCDRVIVEGPMPLVAGVDVVLEARLSAITAYSDRVVTQLYDSIVSDVDWAEAEHVLQLTADTGLFDVFAHEASAHATWMCLCGLSAVDGDTPHQHAGGGT